jgi:hypothetical protein
VQALQLASEQSKTAKTYYYRVDYPVNLPDQACQMDRSPHGSEPPFVFGSWDAQAGFDWIGQPQEAQDAAVRRHLQD